MMADDIATLRIEDLPIHETRQSLSVSIGLIVDLITQVLHTRLKS